MSDTYTTIGKIKLIGETQTFGSGFTKREFVITTLGEYPDDIKFEVVKDKCDALNSVSVGQEIEVSFNIRGNEWGGKYYVNLQCWRFNINSQAQVPHPPQAHQQTTPQPAANMDDQSDIPF